MGTAQFTPLARDDLKGIRDYIARDKPNAASQYMEILKKACAMLADSPGLGIQREGYCGLHQFPVDAYLIFYRPAKTGIDVIRILHGSRDIEAIINPGN